MNFADVTNLPGRRAGPADTRACSTPGDIPQQLIGLLENMSAKLDELHALVAGATKSFYTVSEVAVLLGRSSFTVRRWVSEGRINATRIAGTGPHGRLLIPRPELVKLVSQGLGGELSEPVASASLAIGSLD